MGNQLNSKELIEKRSKTNGTRVVSLTSDGYVKAVYDSIPKASKGEGISYTSANRCVRQGAVVKGVRLVEESKSEFSFNNQIYPSKSEYCKAHNKKYLET